jgi:hypothetical protein
MSNTLGFSFSCLLWTIAICQHSPGGFSAALFSVFQACAVRLRLICSDCFRYIICEVAGPKRSSPSCLPKGVRVYMHDFLYRYLSCKYTTRGGMFIIGEWHGRTLYT